MRIDLHIERLVLDGLTVTAADSPRVRAAVEAELARLLAAGGVNREFAAGGAMPRLNAPQVTLAARPRPDAIGRAIAQSVNASLGGMAAQTLGEHNHIKGRAVP
jgi:hypothetical protein